MASAPKDQCIVLPFHTDRHQPFNGTGLALHFLLGNVLVLHTGLKEMWFGWRVKKIFADRQSFQDYCRDAASTLDLTAVSREQKVRLWLYGNCSDQTLMLSLYDARMPDAVHPPENLAIYGDDHLIGFRTRFVEWLAARGFPLPEEQVQAALWPEKISRDGLDAVGRALEVFYVYSAYGGQGPLDGSAFKKAIAAAPESFMAQDLYGWARYRNRDYQAARGAFLTSLSINPAGAGAMSGMMWCGVYGKDREEAMFWSGRKADVLRQDVQAAREAGRQRYLKANP
ncbi:hypothetical protein DSCA_48130 [Desulfosarcina alkanivorans]|jgi:hypothetical protein|uniref:Uncharacterized protein n=1 Tax=Desulfosarcina alkanivorans TaxID=571177 RepID=A0A5K7YRR9_9BACT|nr:hypothetical protein [Desulfosarcina alkanivorans]BBO70883.1 hypothetical protein DSCA_48130 [Desulfosarcina alkanivorans]